MSLSQVRINNTIDPSDSELIHAADFLSSYLQEFNIKQQYLPDFNKYWPAEDCRTYRIPDQMVFAINTSIPTYMLGTPTILYAKPEEGRVHLKTIFSNIDSSGNILVTSITNHYVQKDAKGKLQFVNPMAINGADWQTTTIRNVKFYYPPYHKFEKKKATELIDKIKLLEMEWQLEPIPVRYFFADTKEELEHLRGFDFTIAMGNRDKPSGMSNNIDNIVYCGGWGEAYFHELVHIYLNRLFPQSPLTEGLSVFYGGSLGHELKWHVLRLQTYLNAHPEIDLNHPEDFHYLDNQTNPLSTIMGLLCYISYQKDGIAGLRRTMTYKSLVDLFTKEYGLGNGDWNTFLRNKITEFR